MATTRTKDVGVTKTTLAADTYLYGDGNTDGSHKILGSDVANYVATEEGGNTLASLSGGKVPTAQLPWTSETFLGTSTVAGLPAPGGLSAGEYYITTDSGTNHSVTFAAGDKAISDGTSYYAVADGVRPIGEGGTGSSTAEGARTNLEVDSKDEIAETINSGEPSLYFNGSNDYVSVADNAALSFTDGTDDLPFSVSAWVKMKDATSFYIASKSDSGSIGEYSFFVSASDKLQLLLKDNSAGISINAASSDTLTSYEGQWVNLAATFTATSAVTARANDITLYINGKEIASSATNNGSYAGMEDTADAFWIGRSGGVYAEGEIRNVQLFNSALTAAQVEQVYRSGVPFELSQAAPGTLTTGWTNGGSGFDTFTDSGVDITSGVTDGSAAALCYSDTFTLTAGKRYRVSFDYTENSRSGSDWKVKTGSDTSLSSSGGLNELPTGDHEFVATASGTHRIGFRAASGVSVDFSISGFRVEEIGAILDLNAADVTGTNLPDRSSNGFAGTLNSMTTAANAVNLPAAISSHHPNPASGEALMTLGNGGSGDDFSVTEDWSGTWTPSLQFSGANTGMTFSKQEGYYVKIGNFVVATFNMTLTAKGSSTGTATITGLPFNGRSATENPTGGATLTRVANVTGLTSAVLAQVNVGTTTATLSDATSTGTVALDQGNISDTTILGGTIIYISQ